MNKKYNVNVKKATGSWFSDGSLDKLHLMMATGTCRNTHIVCVVETIEIKKKEACSLPVVPTWCKE